MRIIGTDRRCSCCASYCTPAHDFRSLSTIYRRQAGLALDPGNAGLQASLAATREAQEIERREQWKQAALERDAQEEKLKAQDAAKARAKAAAAEAKAGSSAATTEAALPADPLSSFLADIQGEKDAPPPPKVEKVLNDKYTNQELGTPQEQMDRLLQQNYKWKNLNAFETLQLGADATVEDIKQRCQTWIFSSLTAPACPLIPDFLRMFTRRETLGYGAFHFSLKNPTASHCSCHVRS